MSFGGFASFAETSFSGQPDLNKVFLTGNSVTSSVGNIINIANATVVLTTAGSVTTSIGNFIVTDFQTVIPDTNVVTASTGTVTITGDANFAITGNVATAAVGDVVVKAGARVVLTTAGVATTAMSFDGTTIVAKAVIVPDGSVLTTSSTVGGVITWNDIDPNASQTWTNIET